MSNSPRIPVGSGGSISDLREHNLSRILLALAAESPLSRAQLAARTGLGVTAMTKLIAELLTRGLARESVDSGGQGLGRPTAQISPAGHRWSTGTLNLDNGAIHAGLGGIDGSFAESFTQTTAQSLDLEAYLQVVEAVVARLAELSWVGGRELLAVEVAVPGAVDSAQGVMTRSILNGWPHPHPLRATVQEMLLAQPHGVAESVLVGIDRSTNYSLQGLLGTHPAPASARTVAQLGGLYAVSGGIYTRSAIEHGSTGLAGDFGHFMIDPAGAACWCGRRGCVETRLGLAGIYGRCLGDPGAAAALTPQLARRYQEMTGELLARADAGEQLVLDELESAGYWLGISVDTIAGIVNPGELLIDGYLSALERHLRPAMNAQLASMGGPPALRGLRVGFTGEPFAPVNRGMHLAAGLAVARNPSAAR